VRQVLFYVPDQFLGIPVFGWGWLLLLWSIAVAISLAVLWRRQQRDEIWGTLPVIVLIAAAILFLLPRLEAQAPDGRILGLPIRGYGTMLLVGILAGLGLTVHLARRVSIDRETIFSLAFWMFIGGIAGGRALYVGLNWDDFRRESVTATAVEIAKFTEGGLVVFGALAGGLVAFFLFTRVHRQPRLLLADVIAPGLALGLALGRIGCLFNGCCFGGECHGPLAIEFPRYTCVPQQVLSPPYAHQLSLGRLHGIRLGPGTSGAVVTEVDPVGAADKAGVRRGMPIAAVNGIPASDLATVQKVLLRSGAEVALRDAGGDVFSWRIAVLPSRSLPVHPTQVYSAVDGAVLCFFLWCLFPLRPVNGVVFASEMTIHPVTRFLLEVIRDDEPGRWGTALTISQLISLLTLVLVCGLWVYLWRHPDVAALPPQSRAQE